jgi:hypothetical protein
MEALPLWKDDTRGQCLVGNVLSFSLSVRQQQVKPTSVVVYTRYVLPQEWHIRRRKIAERSC